MISLASFHTGQGAGSSIANDDSIFVATGTKTLTSGVTGNIGLADWTEDRAQDWAVIESDGRVSLAKGNYVFHVTVDYGTSSATGVRSLVVTNTSASAVQFSAAALPTGFLFHSFPVHIDDGDDFGSPSAFAITQNNGGAPTNATVRITIIKTS